MKRRRAFTVIDNIITGSILLIFLAILLPIFAKARQNARRSSCQSNLRQIHVALRQYTADFNGRLPVTKWVPPLKAYAKKNSTFRCPSKGSPLRVSDYFFNGHFLSKPISDIKSPPTLILVGDGKDDSPLVQRPATWLTNNYSPAWRHMNGANYGFADGHIKWLKPDRVSSDFRMVNP